MRPHVSSYYTHATLEQRSAPLERSEIAVITSTLAVFLLVFLFSIFLYKKFKYFTEFRFREVFRRTPKCPDCEKGFAQNDDFTVRYLKGLRRWHFSVRPQGVAQGGTVGH